MQPPKEQFMFLVIQQKMIGDVLASTIICESLKHYYPNAIVHFVANENTLAVIERNPFIDEVIIFKNEYRSSKKKFFTFLKTLRKTKYSATIDAYGKIESNIITLFSNADKKIGNYKWYTKWVYTHLIHQKKINNTKIPLSISNRLLFLDTLVTKNDYLTAPSLYLSPKEIEIAQKNIADNIKVEGSKLIMISILGSASHKTYPLAYMAQLLNLICLNKKPVLLFNYIPKQKNDAIALYNLCNKHTQACIAFNFYAKSLRNFIALLSQCDMIIGNEGGAINMAKALKIPSFSIFSPFINKGSWHGEMYKNDVCVHLADYFPELFNNKTRSELKKNSATLYKAYKPKLFKKSLLKFLEQQDAN